MKKARILFFICSPSPTTEEQAKALEAAATLKASVGFRDVSQMQPGDKPELADGYAGQIPASYIEAFPDLVNLNRPTAQPKVEIPEKAPSEPTPVAITPTLTPELRAAQDEGAKGASVEQLKQALDGIGITYPANASKAKLLALWIAR